MLYNQSMAKIIPFTQARSNLTEILDELEDHHEHVLITRNGRPSAVLLSADEFEALEETLEILQDDELMEALQRSAREAKEEDLVSLEALRNGRK